MISYTHADLHNKTQELQELAKRTPVLIQDGETKQVLMSYDRYKELAGEQVDKPFVSAYDAYMAIMADFSEEQLDALADADVEFDMSFVGVH